MFAIAYIPVILYFTLEKLRKRPVNELQENKGSNTLIVLTLLGMILIPTIFYFVDIFDKFNSSIGLYSGIIIGLAGIYIRRSAIKSLGRFYSRNIGVQGKHQLIRKGWYRLIRHPGYLGTFLTFVGFGISSGHWISILVNVLLFLVTYSYRIKVEEEFMMQQFGNEYKQYKQSSWRIIPFIY